MKWQYRTVAFDIPRGFFPFKTGGQVKTQEITQALNQLGSEEWELVSSFDTNYEGGSTSTVVCILKRPEGGKE